MKSFIIKFIEKLSCPWRYNVFFAYILWFFGGLFGAHHFYLRRDRHAFVCSCTAGGCFGMGLLYDFFYIPYYVNLENSLRFSKERRFDFTDPEKRPNFSLSRIFWQSAFGIYMGTVFLAIFPLEYFNEHKLKILVAHAIVVALGVHTVANIGKLRCSFKMCLLGSCVPLALATFADLDATIFYTSLCSSFVAYLKGWRYAEPRDRSNYNLLMRFLCVYSSAALVYFLLFNALYLNTRITAGEVKMPFGDYVQNNLSWKGIKDSLKQLLETLKNFGWVEFFLHFIDIMSPESFQVDAEMQVLQLQRNATEAEITAQYRKLVKKWHPDKFVTSSAWDKKWAEKQFILVRQAYVELMNYRKRRFSGKSDL